MNFFSYRALFMAVVISFIASCGAPYIKVYQNQSLFVNEVQAKRKKLTVKKAEKGIKKYIKKEIGLDTWYINLSEKKKNKIIIWVKWTQTGVFTKYVINRKTGKTKGYAPYLGCDTDSDENVNLDVTFNMYDYI